MRKIHSKISFATKANKKYQLKMREKQTSFLLGCTHTYPVLKQMQRNTSGKQ